MPANDREYQRNYIFLYNVLSPLVECQCGSIVKKCNIYHHRRNSKRHYIYINEIPKIQKLEEDVDELKKIIEEIEI